MSSVVSTTTTTTPHPPQKKILREPVTHGPFTELKLQAGLIITKRKKRGCFLFIIRVENHREPTGQTYSRNRRWHTIPLLLFIINRCTAQGRDMPGRVRRVISKTSGSQSSFANQSPLRIIRIIDEESFFKAQTLTAEDNNNPYIKR